MTGSWRDVWRAYLRAPGGVLATVAGVVLVAIAVVGPAIWGDAATTPRPEDAWLGPSSAHLLGTDDIGRDVFARVLAATRTTLLLGLTASGFGAAGGVLLGTVISMLPARPRRFGMRVVDVLLAFPPILVAILVVSIIGAGQLGAIVGIGAALVPSFARLSATIAASVGGRDFVSAAKVLGIPAPRVLTRYVLLNGSDSLLVTASVAVATSIVAISSLSFLGLGVQPPRYDWGQMLTTGLGGIYANPGAAIGPALAIVFAGVWATGFGEAWARALNPVLWTSRRRDSRTRDAADASDAAPVGLDPQEPAADGEVLYVRDLHVRFPATAGQVHAVDGFSLTIRRGEVIGLVGESGCGKSSAALALAGAASSRARVTAEAMRFAGCPVPEDAVARRRALTRLAMVFQDPMSSLNPALRIGTQLTEAVRVHHGVDAATARRAAVERLDEVGIDRAAERMNAYPHELSGGMRQRVMIAMGLMTDPALLIADEPTTALDVRVQHGILDLLARLNRERGLAILLISHDLGVITEICQRVDVLYAGRVVERLAADRLLSGEASHPYTRALLGTLPGLDSDRERPLTTIPGTPPRLTDPIAGCAFASRCTRVEERCRTHQPELVVTGTSTAAACWVVTR